MTRRGRRPLPPLRSFLAPPPVWRELRFGLEMRSLARDPLFRDPSEAVRSRAVMLIPGFLTGDQALRMMGSWLKRSGHRTCRAGIRLNVDCSEASVGRLEKTLERFCAEQADRAFLVGQSRGGLFARALAVRRPDLVCGIVTLGSPHLDPYAVHPLVWLQGAVVGAAGTLGVPGVATKACATGECCGDFSDDLGADLQPGIRFVSVYSRSDGIVDWRACLDPTAHHVEVDSTHCGMSVHRDVFEIVARALRPRLTLQKAEPAPARRRAVA